MNITLISFCIILKDKLVWSTSLHEGLKNNFRNNIGIKSWDVSYEAAKYVKKDCLN